MQTVFVTGPTVSQLLPIMIFVIGNLVQLGFAHLPRQIAFIGLSIFNMEPVLPVATVLNPCLALLSHAEAAMLDMVIQAGSKVLEQPACLVVVEVVRPRPPQDVGGVI